MDLRGRREAKTYSRIMMILETYQERFPMISRGIAELSRKNNITSNRWLIK